MNRLDFPEEETLHTTPGRGWIGVASRIVGELLVIVVGVLVALSADAWLQSREDRQAEARQLEALRDDVEESRALPETSNEQWTRLFASLVRLVDDDLDRIPTDSVARWVYDGLFLMAGYEPRLAGVRDLQTSKGSSTRTSWHASRSLPFSPRPTACPLRWIPCRRRVGPRCGPHNFGTPSPSSSLWGRWPACAGHS